MGKFTCESTPLIHGRAEEEWIVTPDSEWQVHEDQRIDAAAFITAGTTDRPWDWKAYPISGFVDRCSSIQKANIGIGDDLIFPGLFVRRPGKLNNIPILRMGTIASMSQESVYRQEFGWMPVYLVEARSIGGHSGSPVYVRLAGNRTPDGVPRVYLFGLIHGHVDDEESGKINSGIAVVVPAQRIRELLDQPFFARIRDNVAAKHL